MKKITLFALCMLILGSGAAMAGTYNYGNLVLNNVDGTLHGNITINEGSGNFFNVISVGITGGLFLYGPDPGALSQFVDESTYDTHWSWDNISNTSAFGYADGFMNTWTHPDPFVSETTAESFGITFSEISKGATFDINLFLVTYGTSLDQYTSGQHVDSYELTYSGNTQDPWGAPAPAPASTPEPSLVLLLGIGLGAVVLMMWRRGV